MTKEQIEEFSKKLIADGNEYIMLVLCDGDLVTNESVVALDEIDAAFCEGAEYAEGKAREECDAAFKWHKVDSNDPVKPEMLEAYLCYDGYVYTVAYKDGNNWFDINSGDKVTPVAWCKFIHAPQDIDENPKS